MSHPREAETLPPPPEADTRDTDPSPPNYDVMTDREIMIYATNAVLAFHAEQKKQGRRLTSIESHVALIENQLVTGDKDPQTIAQRLQATEALAKSIDEKLDINGGRFHGRIESLEKWRDEQRREQEAQRVQRGGE